MQSQRRKSFNRAYTDTLMRDYQRRLEHWSGPTPFRLAETPLFVDDRLKQELADSSEAICTQLSQPAVLEALKKAIPATVNAPGMDALPDCVQVDFALVRGEDGLLRGRLVELQAFPSLYALETLMADSWKQTLEKVPGFEDTNLTCFFDLERDAAVAWMKQVVVGDEDPFETALVDYQPDLQKTLPDFHATRLLFGVSPVCVTKLIREGRRLYRETGGRRVPVRRIYNRMVFDELEAKKVALPFSFTDDLDVSWCSHPNWYWTWSKFALPYLDHPSVPKTRYLSDFGTDLPEDLENYVLKPLFSFAGSGVNIDLTRAAIDAIPEAQRSGYLLQRKVEYAPVIDMPHHAEGFDPAAPGVKAECRVMLLRHSFDGPRPLRPLIVLVRSSRGRMLGVDQNRGVAQNWSGGTVALFG